MTKPIEWNTKPDPGLKFALGVCKGQQLDSVGIPYRIVTYKGEKVARFQNGAMAKFYRDANILVQPAQSPELSDEVDQGVVIDAPATAKHPYAWESQGPCETTGTERFANPNCVCQTYAGNLGPCQAFEEGSNGRCVYCDHEKTCHAPMPNAETFLHKLHERYFRKPQITIAAYREQGRRPSNPCDPVYVVRERGAGKEYADRDSVGTGLREYLWLYGKLRTLGRGRFAAAWEAQEVYFL